MVVFAVFMSILMTLSNALELQEPIAELFDTLPQSMHLDITLAQY